MARSLHYFWCYFLKNLAAMKKTYTRVTLFDGETTALRDMLDPTDSVVLLADNLPWEKLTAEYEKTLKNDERGAGNVNSRVALGAIIVKYMNNLSDVNTIQEIQRNPYYQYLCGREYFGYDPVFDPSLFVTIRKRITSEIVNNLSLALMKEGVEITKGKEIVTFGEAYTGRKQSSKVSGKKSKAAESETETADEEGLFPSDVMRSLEAVAEDGNKGQETENAEAGNVEETKKPAKKVTDDECLGNLQKEGLTPDIEKKGHVKVDGTCCPVEVRYPCDLDILNDCRENLERIIGIVYKSLNLKMPRTYKHEARKEYLQLKTKKLMRNSKNMRKGIKTQLGYVKRDLGYLEAVLEKHPTALSSLKRRDLELYETIQVAYEQQRSMFESGTHSVKDRIVSIFQPHVRPIVRGKQSANVEFGPKIGVAVVEKYSFVDHFSWDAFNEGGDMVTHLKRYKERMGCLPTAVYADKIYLNKTNRQILRVLGIRAAGEPLGRTPKYMLEPEALRQLAKDKAARNEIEGKFGTSKRTYDADDIRAKRPDTGEAWTCLCLFAGNLGTFVGTLKSAQAAKA